MFTRWTMSRLGSSERVAIEAAMDRAVSDLEGSFANAPQLALLGLPSVAEANAMLALLREHL